MRTTQIFFGQAQLPKGFDLYENYKILTAIVKIDRDSGVILDVEVPIYCKMGNDFIVDIIKGKSLSCDINVIILEIEERVHSTTKKALITALQMIYNSYIFNKSTKT